MRKFALIVLSEQPDQERLHVSVATISDEREAELRFEDTVLNEDLLFQLLPLMDEYTLIGYRLNLSVLQRALTVYGYDVFHGRYLDMEDVMRIRFPMLPAYGLEQVCAHLGLSCDLNETTAAAARLLADIWIHMMEKYEALPLITVQRLASVFDGDYSDLGAFFETMRDDRERSVSIDSDDASYYRGFAMNVGDWGGEEPIRSEAETLPDSFAEFQEQIMNNLKSRLPNFEQREAQTIMLGEVNDAFEQEHHLLIEAGTGTGKSLGYLIPSLYYGVKNGTKMIVSTHTINLQEQLRQRDIPLLQRISPVPFHAALLKGRSHYLCLRKFEQHVQSMAAPEQPNKDRLTAAQMIVWLSETQMGEDEELNMTADTRNAWREVASDAESCLNRSCPWFKKCFYHRARHDATRADVIITNHSLLFTDVIAEHRLLPAYEHLVVDEAHHFADVAENHLGNELQYFNFLHMLQQLYRDSRSGDLPLLVQRLTGFEEENEQQWRRDIEKLYPELIRVKEYWDELNEALYQQLLAGGSAADESQFTLRLKPGEHPAHWDKLQALEKNIGITIDELLKTTDRILNEMKEHFEDLAIEGILTDISGSLKDLKRQRENLRFFIQAHDKNYVYWMEGNNQFKSKSMELHSVPIDVSEMLRDTFFENKESIVMTSATLAVEKSFDYICEQIGLDTKRDSERVKTVKLPSPFHYRQQALVVIPRDFPGIRGINGEQEFVTRLISSLRDAALMTQGRMMVLFTSYRMLRQVYPELKKELEQHSIEVLAQGMDSNNRSQLTRLFREHHAAVLLGTSSFWEGVDIPGEDLICLCIVRLPFQPPNHPIVQAKTERLREMNKNPFISMSVPQAVIRFKQGFGRLVRTASDRGIVIIYDTRVIEARYGRHFLYSLPGPKIEHMPDRTLASRIRDWMEGEASEINENL